MNIQKISSPSSQQFDRFGQFLINRGIVDEEAVFDALNEQLKQSIPIGTLALEENLLGWIQIIEILNAQCDTTKLFGEIAIELGYLKEKDIKNLLEIKKKRSSPIGEILVKQNKISRETLEKELVIYHNSVKNQNGG